MSLQIPIVRLLLDRDRREQSGEPDGPEERRGPRQEVGEEGICPPHAGMGQARREAEGKREEEVKAM